MRIISGKWGGRKLASFKSEAIRPTTDRVKETVFNMIGPEILEASFLDLFCGTGSVTFEALSRGALDVYSVDMGKDSKNIIMKNAKALGADRGFKFVSNDVLKFLERNMKSFDLIFIDPPFTKKMGAQVMRALEKSKALQDNTEVYIEYVRGEELYEPEEEALDSRLYVYKKRDYKDKYLYVYRAKES